MLCLCVVGCSVNGACPIHGDVAFEAAARAAYEAYLENMRPIVPLGLAVGWERVPERVRDGWRAAAKAAIEASK